MKLLLDTHIILWFQSSDSKLLKAIRELIENTDNQCYISFGSLWEIAIKISLNKLNIDVTYNEFYYYLLENEFQILTVTINHLNTLLTLPLYNKDPFDRLLIAQAITENLTLISADQHFNAYPVNLLQ